MSPDSDIFETSLNVSNQIHESAASVHSTSDQLDLFNLSLGNSMRSSMHETSQESLNDAHGVSDDQYAENTIFNDSFNEVPQQNLRNAIKLYISRNQLPEQAIYGLVELLSLSRATNEELPPPSSLFKYKPKNILNQLKLCTLCQDILSDNYCTACQREISKPIILIVGDIKHQFTSLLSDRDLDEKIQETYDHVRHGGMGNFGVYAGSIHRNFRQSFTTNDISVVINTDGFNVFSTSRNEPWPIVMTVNELDYKSRYRFSNIIICGLFCGTSHPKFEKILTYIFDGQWSIFEEGLTVSGIQRKVILMQNCCDKPARSALLGHSGHHSAHGCIYCYS